MANRRKPKTFERSRRLAFQRHRAQAVFRDEPYEITEHYWNTIWTEERFLQRGMKAENICLVRRDITLPWQQGNLVLITRQRQLAINNKSQHSLAYKHLFENAVWRDDV